MKLNIELDPYETFMKSGYGDGDDPGAEWAISKVAQALYGHGWDSGTVAGIHNQYIRELTNEGKFYDLPTRKVAYCNTGDEVREYLLKVLPPTVIEALDELR